MKPNPEAIKALKRVMPDLETRKLFVDNCIKQNGENFLKSCNYDTIIYADLFCFNYCYNDLFNDLYYCDNSFHKESTKEGHSFWSKIYISLTPEERKLKLFIK